MKRVLVALVVLSAVFCVNAVKADALAKPTGKVILTISGNISNVNTGNHQALFDRKMLMQLGMVRNTTSTPWSEGVDVYEGPLLRSVLGAVGVRSGKLVVKALNDYSAVVPVEDSNKYDVILAMDMNGKPMGIRDKGPLFIVYPFDQFTELNNEIIHNRSVWQIKSIHVE